MVKSVERVRDSRAPGRFRGGFTLYADLLLLLVVALWTGSLSNAVIPMYLHRQVDLPSGVVWMDSLPGAVWVGIAMTCAMLLVLKQRWVRSRKVERAINFAALGALVIFAGFLAYVSRALTAGILCP
jgi:hypothetical protein